MTTRGSLSISCLLLALGCGHKSAGPEGNPAPTEGSAAAAPAPAPAASSTFTFDAPRFAIDLPEGAGAKPTIEKGDGSRHAETKLTFDMPKGELMWISAAVPFSPPAKSIADSMEMFSTPADNHHTVTKGTLPGGGAWTEDAGALYHTVISWLPIGDTVVQCWITGTAERAAACKTLRAAT